MSPAETAPWQLLAKFAGSVGLFLLGMTLLTDGLTALAGPGMRRTLQAMTGNPVRGFAGGVVMTVLSQASSATVLATVGFVTAGILSLSAAIPVVVGLMQIPFESEHVEPRPRAQLLVWLQPD